MLKMIHIRNSVIIVLCIAIICLGIGFMVLATHLKEVSNEEHSFSVIFTDIEKISSAKGSTKEPRSSVEITPNGSRLKFHFTLEAIHDEIVYKATIKNNGTLPAEITDVIESPNYKNAEMQNIIKPVSITLSDIKGKIIPAGSETTIKLNVYYNPTEQEVKTKDFDYDLSFTAKSVS